MNIDFFIEPFQYGFMTRALVGTTLVSLLSAIIGSFLVLKGLAFIGDAIAHTSFAGIAIALLLGLNLYLGAIILAIFTAVGVTFLNRTSKVRNDTALAILFTGAFALGVILLSAMPNFAGDLSSLLLGSVLAIRPQEVYLIGGTVLFVGLIVSITFEHLVFSVFDPTGAEAAGLPVTWLDLLLMILTAVSIVVAIQAVGMILVVALMITPAATASLFTKKLSHMMILAGILGLFASFIGIIISFHFAAPPGATVVLVATIQFAIGLAISKMRR